ncbi:MAG: HD domain-containing protein [Desulfomonile tiedjei]|nr:HD domain-containing protein [Desulfomonile tiedjei]
MPQTHPTVLVYLFNILGRLAPESYLVGGAVRDALSGGYESADLDIAVRGDGFEVARTAADMLGAKATFVPLDAARGTARLVLGGDEPITVDISSFKGGTIVEDLVLRDFTVNAMAVSIEDYREFGYGHLIDPCGGQQDLRNKIVRVCSAEAFSDDPLRVLRAFRFAASLGFSIDREVMDLIPPNLERLPAVSPERIRDELFAVLSAPSSFPVLKMMSDAQVFDAIVPELKPMKGCGQNEYHHLDVWDHSLEAVRAIEEVVPRKLWCFGEPGGKVERYLREEPVKGRPRVALLKVAALFHDAGKPQARFVDPTGRVRFFGHEKVSEQLFLMVAERLKLAHRETETVAKWIRGHMRPSALLARPTVSKRSIYRLHQRFGEDLTGLFALFLADLAASRGPARPEGLDDAACLQLQEAMEINAEMTQPPPSPLLNGRDVMEAFGLSPGPLVGSILKRLAVLQACGEISNRDQALSAAQQFYRERAGQRKTRSDG